MGWERRETDQRERREMAEEKDQVTKMAQFHQEELHREGHPNHSVGGWGMTGISSNRKTLRDAGRT